MTQVAGAGAGELGRAVSSPTRGQRFKLSLSFLSRKKKRKEFLGQQEEDAAHAAPDGNNHGAAHLPETGFGDILQDIAEENEELLQQENGNAAEGSSGGVPGDAEHEGGLARGGADAGGENFTGPLDGRSLSGLDLSKGPALAAKVPMTYKSFDIDYPPGGSPPSRRRTERSSSMKAFDASTRSGSMRTESTSTQISTGGHSRLGKSWLSTRCGFRSCSKQIDMEAELRSKERAKHIDRNRSQRSRTRSTDTTGAWETDTVSEWSALAAMEKDSARNSKKFGSRKKQEGRKKSGKHTPLAAGCLPSEGGRASTPEIKCLLRDVYEEVREAAKYDLPSHRSEQLHRADGSRHSQDSSADMDTDSGEEDPVHPWERSFSSPSSDGELFTTSYEVDGKPRRRKKWSSNSSDETDGRHRRAAKSKSTWAGGEQDDEVDDRTGKKGSRIIFLSTPPRPEDLGMDDEDPTANDQILLNSAGDEFADYGKLDQGVQVFDRPRSGSRSAGQTAADMEANAKAWAKADPRGGGRGGGSPSDAGVRELPMDSRSHKDAKGRRRFRHIDVQIDDQMVNLRLESDPSDSSQGQKPTRGSSKIVFKKGVSKPSDEEKPLKKKRGVHRRRRGRKAKPPPPLPSDLHGKVKESVAVVKSSYDPYSDFRDSMVEMIVEKEIQGATDLEELLRCYLSLNSAEYHSVIVKVFADVWRELFADAI